MDRKWTESTTLWGRLTTSTDIGGGLTAAVGGGGEVQIRAWYETLYHLAESLYARDSLRCLQHMELIASAGAMQRIPHVPKEMGEEASSLATAIAKANEAADAALVGDDGEAGAQPLACEEELGNDEDFPHWYKEDNATGDEKPNAATNAQPSHFPGMERMILQKLAQTPGGNLANLDRGSEAAAERAAQGRRRDLWGVGGDGRMC